MPLARNALILIAVLVYILIDRSFISVEILEASKKLIFVAGVYTCVQFILWIADFIQLHLIARNDCSMYGAKTKKAYAIVTGASAGIGRALALELAKRGMNLIIVARTKKNLDNLKEEIQAKYPNGIEVEVCPLDCYDIAASTETLAKKCQELKVTMLVNNVGCESGEPEPLELKSSADMQQIIDLNITFNAQLTRACLGSIIENVRSLRVKGIVVNLASQAALLENPLISTYSAAKAFNTSFSRALAGEMRCNHHGIIDICNLRPAFVESAMSGLKAEGLKGLLLGVVLPETFAELAVNKFGPFDDISPVVWHDIIGIWFSRILPCRTKEAVLYRLSMTRYNKKVAKANKLGKRD